MTMPYNPQQNMVIERKNRAITGAARSMLHERKNMAITGAARSMLHVQTLPLYLWDEVSAAAVYL
jgi:hypothetical protein